MQAYYWPIRNCVLVSVLLVLLSAAGQAQMGFSIQANDTASDEEQIEAALTQRASIDFVETPLAQVVETMGERFRLPMVLAPKKLEEAAVSVDTPVTKKLSNLPLESLLRLLLEELDLDFTVRDNVLLITTPEDVESRLDTRIYPVLDLVTPRLAGSKVVATAEADYEPLIDLIASTIEPQSWDQVGGPGSIAPLDNAGALVISQTRDEHRKIASLLASVRRVKIYQGIPAIPLPRVASSRTSLRMNNGGSRQYAPTRAQAWQVPQVYAER